MSPIEFGFGRSVLYVAVAMMTLLQPVQGAERHPTDPSEKNATQAHGPLEHVFRQLPQARWITEGRSPRIMYVFFDPNCPYCHYLYGVSQHFVRSDLVEVRWIPVGFLEPSSVGKAAAILEAKDPHAALARNENGYHRPGGGGIQEVLPSRAAQAQLDRNLALFKETGAGGVPLIMWEDRSGRVRVQDGAVDKQTFAYLIHHIRPARK